MQIIKSSVYIIRLLSICQLTYNFIPLYAVFLPPLTFCLLSGLFQAFSPVYIYLCLVSLSLSSPPAISSCCFINQFIFRIGIINLRRLKAVNDKVSRLATPATNTRSQHVALHLYLSEAEADQLSELLTKEKKRLINTKCTGQFN